MRIAIALSVLFAGIALPHKFVKIHARSLALLLAGAMVGGWLMCGLLIVRRRCTHALVLGAKLTPAQWWLIPGLTYVRRARDECGADADAVNTADGGSRDRRVSGMLACLALRRACSRPRRHRRTPCS
jgi:hypothetical protein